MGQISQLFLIKWDYCKVIQDELETCKSTKEESKKVEIDLMNMLEWAEEIIDHLNSRSKRHLEE